MDQYLMVVLIVAISVSAGVATTYLKTRAQTAGDDTARASEAALRDEIGQLKERVRVLETIVTDRDRALSDEIRKLA